MAVHACSIFGFCILSKEYIGREGREKYCPEENVFNLFYSFIETTY
jgi:hypothetical protein